MPANLNQSAGPGNFDPYAALGASVNPLLAGDRLGDLPAATSDTVPSPEDSAGKPKLLLMGMRRSGKSSIANVVFHKLAPSETMFLETTTRLRQESMYSFMEFQVWDFPGHIQYFGDTEAPNFDVDTIFSGTGALIWVIDAQDEYSDTIWPLITTILHLKENNFDISVHIFVHKVDGLSENHRAQVFQDIVQRVQDELNDNDYPDFSTIGFHQTSIYNHSVFEAFSHVIRKLIPELPMIEGLLDSLCARSGIQKAYVFDVLTKIAVASDTSPADSENYETCSDYIDLVVDISELYGWDRFGQNTAVTAANSASNGSSSTTTSTTTTGQTALSSSSLTTSPLLGQPGPDGAVRVGGRAAVAASPLPPPPPASEASAPNPAALSGKLHPVTGSPLPLPGELARSEPGNTDTESLVTRADGRSMFLYLREMNQYLVLVCIMNERMPLDRKALCAHNVRLFQHTLNKIFQVSVEASEARRQLFLQKQARAGAANSRKNARAIHP